MNRAALTQYLRDAIVTAVRAFRRERPGEQPYAFALVGGQAGNYIGFAIATEEGLGETAKRYVEWGDISAMKVGDWEEVDHAREVRGVAPMGQPRRRLAVRRLRRLGGLCRWLPSCSRAGS